jgi:anaerobic dimethyl sulfoxide reductase subunit B (iron-sulfur subunit)
MAEYGLLIDYEYCTNCGSCVVSCKEEHDYPVGQWGIRLHSDGPWQIGDDEWNWNWYPLPTDLCDLCEQRTVKGREPICVHHCLSNILYYGKIEDLAKKLADKPKQLLVVPGFRPKQAKGEFVHRQNKTDKHTAAHISAVGDGHAEFGAHRHDARVGEYEAEAAKQ